MNPSAVNNRMEILKTEYPLVWQELSATLKTADAQEQQDLLLGAAVCRLCAESPGQQRVAGRQPELAAGAAVSPGKDSGYDGGRAGSELLVL